MSKQCDLELQHLQIASPKVWRLKDMGQTAAETKLKFALFLEITWSIIHHDNEQRGSSGECYVQLYIV